MTVNRRGLLAAGLGVGGLGIAASGAAAAGRAGAAAPAVDVSRAMPGGAVDLSPNSPDDQSRALQAAIDLAAERRVPLALAPGRYFAGGITLRAGVVLTGAGGTATIALAKPGPLFRGENTHRLALHDINLDGGHMQIGGPGNALIDLKSSNGISLARVVLSASGGRGIALEGCSGRVQLSTLTEIADVALFVLDSTGLDIIDNRVSDCGNNGIQVWRSQTGEDGTIVSRNRISKIMARAGGSGEHGNGINVFRAGSVVVEGNRITDCAYSAVRGNAASNIQMLGNSCQRIGEVALYAEFGFEGAIISGNLVDGAAAGISVTNFDVGGRLAVVQGNLIRNLMRREQEPVDKRGEGISVEADASVVGNTIENAPTAGIVIGWGPHMRDVVATGNLVRNTRVGIAISSDAEAGAVLVSTNMISGAREGAIRAMNKGALHGPDLAREVVATTGRVVVQGNMAG